MDRITILNFVGILAVIYGVECTFIRKWRWPGVILALIGVAILWHTGLIPISI